MRRRPAPLSDLRALVALVRCFRRRRPDVVHAHSSKAGLLARLAARLAGVPRVIYSPHGFAFEMDVAPPVRGLYRVLERLAARWTDRCICLCEHERRLALEQLGYATDRLCLIPNGVAPMPDRSACPSDKPATQGPCEIKSEALKNNLELRNSRIQEEIPITPFLKFLSSKFIPLSPVVGFIGRLCPQKGPDILAVALPMVKQAVPGAHFRFVGEGPLRASLQRRLEATVPGSCWSIEAAVDLDSARGLAGKVDVLAMPSRWEGLPYVLLDALAAGTPVVVAAVGGMQEVITHERNGLLVPPNDPEALAAALIRLLRDDALRARLQSEGPVRAADFSLPDMLERLSAVYEQTG